MSEDFTPQRPPEDDPLDAMVPPDGVDYCEEEHAQIMSLLIPKEQRRTYTEDELMEAQYFMASTGKPVSGTMVMAAGRAFIVLPTGSSSPVRRFVELGFFGVKEKEQR
jgi:hypothetical protein